MLYLLKPCRCFRVQKALIKVIDGRLVPLLCDTVLLRVSQSGRLCMYIYCIGVDNL